MLRFGIQRLLSERLGGLHSPELLTRESEAQFVAIAARLVERGADSVILGCTEVGMLLNQENVSVPVFDTTLIHCEAALDFAGATHD